MSQQFGRDQEKQQWGLGNSASPECCTQCFTPSVKGPGGGSAACPEDGEEKDGEDGEEKAGEKEGQLKKHECGAWTAEKG